MREQYVELAELFAEWHGGTRYERDPYEWWEALREAVSALLDGDSEFDYEEFVALTEPMN